MNLRRKIADSPRFNNMVERLLAGYIRFAYRTSTWETQGFEAMDDVLRTNEPVIVALWHQRLIMAPYLFNLELGQITSLTSTGRAGRLAGQIYTRFGMNTIAMNSRDRHVTMSRKILGKIRDGFSVGIATDGPRGPARVASLVPLIWARASGKRVFVVAFSANRVLELPTWDRQWLPTPWSKGTLVCYEWTETVPRKATDEETETLRLSLEHALDDVTDKADTLAGRALPPKT
ncbi:hypothetical protein DS909_07015 [Phaeobacter gallaeciensis]|uniref:DUF374 domain-containing protein n=2 Tax=Roseobacteraceae TaxID=2854170 RepID=A0A366X1A9_9RHOB|nr:MULTISPECIES: DUF374 domain-containing protein [Roseobacteraceae]MBT3143242.1 DUF374 domain-containing protein [Falsiruegeria litorea]MBT8167506.1 DUF374 domain-containing protein [Falsiruegeria litorea]RBW57894.1 hypothetical protein DS909_07015 [Phaeobacter gallaeciensis]